MKERVSQQTIADYVGVSKNAVSLALTGKSGVSPETRQTIVEAATKLGYVARRSESSVKTRHGPIGIVIRDRYLEEPQFFGPLLALLQHTLADQGRNTLVHAVNPSDESTNRLPVWIDDPGLQAVIGISKLSTEYLLAIRSRVPLMLIDHHDPLVDCDAVVTANMVGGFLATHHLLVSGHTQIGFMGLLPTEGAPSNYERELGYELAMKTVGGPESSISSHALADEWDEDQMISYALESSSPPTAWCCANDLTAFHLVSGLIRHGVRVPEDISVVGFDDLSIATLSRPQLTTVRVDKAEYATSAVRQLLWRLEHHGRPSTITAVWPLLVPRESSAHRSSNREMVPPEESGP